MANIVIRSDEANAAATALLLAARSHLVCLLAPTLLPGNHDFDFFGTRCTVALRREEDLDASAPTVGVVFAEGESVPSGIKRVFESRPPDLLVIIGGGISGAVEATQTARSLGFDVSKILVVGGFLVGGNTSSVRSEKQGILAGFLAPGTPTFLVELAKSVFPQISITSGFEAALSSVNALVHVPPMIFNAMSIERGDDVRFYAEGFGDSVCRLIASLDADRLRLGGAMGFALFPVTELMDRYAGPAGMPGKTLREKVNGFRPFQSIKVPSSFDHRFLAHELRSTFAPMSELAREMGVNVPTIRSVVGIGEVLLDADLTTDAGLLAPRFIALMNASLAVQR